MRIKYNTIVIYYDGSSYNLKYYTFEIVKEFIHIRSNREYGEYKWWYIDGRIRFHGYYNNGKKVKEV